MENYDLKRKINDQIQNAEMRVATPGYGIVMGYNRYDNTATVLLSQPGSDMPGRFYTNVPCPTFPGIQMVAPERGRPCWVSFKDGLQSTPVITHFFHHSYRDLEYERQYVADNDVPRFMLEM